MDAHLLWQDVGTWGDSDMLYRIHLRKGLHSRLKDRLYHKCKKNVYIVFGQPYPALRLLKMYTEEFPWKLKDWINIISLRHWSILDSSKKIIKWYGY